MGYISDKNVDCEKCALISPSDLWPGAFVLNEKGVVM